MMIRSVTLIMSILLALLTGACSGDSHLNEPKGPPAGASFAEVPAGLSGLKLPQPSAFPRLASAPPTDFERYCNGGNFLPGYPQHNVFSIGIGSTGTFSPAYSLPDNATLDKAAYATFWLYNMQEYSGPAEILHGWVVPPADWKNAYMAVASFSSNRWDWFPMDADGSVSLPGWSEYLSPSGNVFVEILLLGTDTCQLDWLIGGESVHSGSYLYTDLNSDPVMNLAPLTVNFTAEIGLLGTTISSYDWDFDNDGSIDVAGSASNTQMHLYELPGQYTCKCLAHAADGKEFTAELTLTAVDPLNQPPVAFLNSDANFGDAPLKVTLNASESSDDDTIVRYEWDIDYDGEYEFDTGSTPTLEYTFARYGITDVVVRVTDNDFAQDTAIWGITLDSGWRTAVVDDSVAIGTGIAMAVNGSGSDSRAMVAYVDNVNEDLFFSRAGTVLGTAWTLPFEPINNSVDVIDTLDMMVNPVSGEPQIAYLVRSAGAGQELYYVTASQPDGSNWDFTTPVSPDTGFGTLVAVAPGAGGKPGVLAEYGDGSGGQTLRYYLASDTDGHLWEPPTGLGNLGFDEHISELDLLNASSFPLAAVSGSFLVGGGTLGFSAAANGSGLTWDELDPVGINGGNVPSLAMLMGKPAVAAGIYAQGASIRFLRSDDAEGRSWTGTVQEIVSSGDGGTPSMAMVGGTPCIAFKSFNSGALMYQTATDSVGSSWNQPYAIDSVVEADSTVVLVNSNGYPVICYSDNIGNRLLAAVWY